MSREKHKELMKEIFSKNKEEIQEIFNSGVFNQIVRGYFVLTLDSCDFKRDKTLECLAELDRTLDEVTAGEAEEYLDIS